MYQAIQTKYLPATNTRGDRIKATCQAGSVTINWPYGLDNEEAFKSAAQALMDKLDWSELSKIAAGGQLPNGDYAFTIVPAKK
jgi:hypothetical protein